MAGNPGEGTPGYDAGSPGEGTPGYSFKYIETHAKCMFVEN